VGSQRTTRVERISAGWYDFMTCRVIYASYDYDHDNWWDYDSSGAAFWERLPDYRQLFVYDEEG